MFTYRVHGSVKTSLSDGAHGNRILDWKPFRRSFWAVGTLSHTSIPTHIRGITKEKGS